ncbi:methionine adenosyltransferase [Zhengella sp. ZM62]|uniref:methionine adenosyltransferase n=1 Tax=Zhengella sedimenti TaxID=3390035 RepID=UPI0039765AEA
MLVQSGLFTSESVSDGHPDKICDQVSDTILDACLSQDPGSRVAIETALKGRTLCLLGEITTGAQLDLGAIARGVLCDIGHAGGHWGLDPDNLIVIEDVTLQSPEIKAGVDGLELGAGDQGIMFGFACDETDALMPLPIELAHALMRRQRELRLLPEGALLGPDAKSQVTVAYENGRPVGIDTVVVSTQHDAQLALADLRDLVRTSLIEPVLGDWLRPDVKIFINPAGSFVHGGPAADAGLTGRKIIVDTYGGYARHGGGAFSGKDATKVDRSAAYAARQLARDVVARGWARACEVRVAYAIGMSRPIDVRFDTFGTSDGQDPAVRYRGEGIDLFDLMRPASILRRLNLDQPAFRTTSTFGHFGRPEFSWEKAVVGDVER